VISKKKFVITAGTLTGNRGSEAMVTTCIQQIKNIFPTSKICIASSYPKQDFKELDKVYLKKYSDIYIYSGTPFSLIFQSLPLSLIAKIAPWLKRNKLKNFGTILDLLNSDIVFDVAGVSFIDGREKFLPFNILSIFPFLLHKRKVIKLSQAMGPFNNLINRSSANIVLNKCTKVFARGNTTMHNLEKLKNKKNFSLAPDITFSLRSSDLNIFNKRRNKYIAIAPSSLVMNKSKKYVNEMVKIIKELQLDGFEIKFIIHSWRKSRFSRNNDLIVAKKINSQLKHKIELLGLDKNSMEIRKEISNFQLIIVSRFHAMISALCTATPLLVIGWSHKYKEILDLFEMESEYCVDYLHFDRRLVIKKIYSIYNNTDQISNSINKYLPKIKKETNKIFISILKDGTN
jgi:colanic acid/amylovoran biosynthesis protein